MMRMNVTVLVVALLAVNAYGAKACSGNYANKDGMELQIGRDGKVVMVFQSNRAECKSEKISNNKTKISCGPGMESTGDFSADCGTLTFNGLSWSKKK